MALTLASSVLLEGEGSAKGYLVPQYFTVREPEMAVQTITVKDVEGGGWFHAGEPGRDVHLHRHEAVCIEVLRRLCLLHAGGALPRRPHCLHFLGHKNGASLSEDFQRKFMPPIGGIGPELTYSSISQ